MVDTRLTEEFLRIDYHFGSGDGSGSGSGYGYKSGAGDGSGNSASSGDGYVDGDGDGDGYGNGNEDGEGLTPGAGCGGGSWSGSGSGAGANYNRGVAPSIKSIGKQIIHHIDGVPTIVDHVRGNIAKGSVLRSDFSFAPCFVVKSNGFFAHGETLKKAMSALQKKIFDGMSESERIDVFVGEFPSLETVVQNKDLFDWHHKLTGSCKMGRDQFVNERGINFNGKMTVGEFIGLTKNSYGGGTIKKLLREYMGKEFEKI